MPNKRQAKYAAKFTRDLIELLDGNNGSHWTKGRFYAWINWRGQYANDEKLCHCVLGGIRELSKRRSKNIADEVMYAIVRKVGPIVAWNDSPNTKWVHVKRALTSVANDFDKVAKT